MPSMTYESLKTNSKYRGSKGVDVFSASVSLAFLGFFSNAHTPNPSPHPTNKDGRVYPEFQNWKKKLRMHASNKKSKNI